MGRCALHPAGRAGGAKAAPLAREGDQQLVATCRAAHPRETLREDAAVQLTPELLHDESRKALVAQVREKGLEMLPHRLVEQGALGLSTAVTLLHPGAESTARANSVSEARPA